ncbi:RagB/SusD family nutrient uptake outer membrane protein [Sphingobacterium bambusae]|uniref:RagB/SusD family nutrient uptake outer membrane protein n=2 Tax=Sphingobacterium bambusae TaxID=662858 RepID=A0ABW6BN34_9SPHI|nr:RagB/SusD family nutrient uptake outer membrane protein [Sphingobacterium bambusae]WPL47915.1 RagB/SusD family nutrient uptake outer membrane protein [Sphingobacterium bambusae]
MIRILYLLLASLACAACSNYLDMKPNASLSTIETLADLRALLDNEFVMSTQTLAGEDMADNYFVLDQTWNASSNEGDRNRYTWQVTENNGVDWIGMYEEIYYANVVLEGLEGLRPSPDMDSYNEIRGTALYYRGLAFSELLLLYAMPYRHGADGSGLGVPLRTSADLNQFFSRASISESYDRVFADLEEAAALLPLTTATLLRPSRLAAWGLMARVAFDIGDYERAFRLSEQLLQQKSDLLDYGQINPALAIPFQPLNSEVVHLTYRYSAFLVQSRGIVDPEIYASYAEGDYRKSLFFAVNANGHPVFKGSYTEINLMQFTGISTAEMLLTNMEAALRTGRLAEARMRLPAFLQARYAPNARPNSNGEAAELLALLQSERRKELIFRNRRWADIRRLNLEGANISLTRELNGQRYLLEPNSLRYALLIPLEAIRYSRITQNPR